MDVRGFVGAFINYFLNTIACKSLTVFAIQN
jgi:hypothetical protein